VSGNSGAPGVLPLPLTAHRSPLIDENDDEGDDTPIRNTRFATSNT
jgi:hypothetical protein